MRNASFVAGRIPPLWPVISAAAMLPVSPPIALIILFVIANLRRATARENRSSDEVEGSTKIFVGLPTKYPCAPMD